MGLVLIKSYPFVAVAIMLYQISRTLSPFCMLSSDIVTSASPWKPKDLMRQANKNSRLWKLIKAHNAAFLNIQTQLIRD